jgi:hypothetical protein|tara:strand:- start:227 stop:475 length:249 start_codon:yes stop_codon:yes gene_type:complete
MRLKDQIKLIKSALKQDQLYSDLEIHYMKKQLNNAKHELKLKKLRRKKGFNELSETSNSNTRSREDDGLRSESEQPEQPRES